MSTVADRKAGRSGVVTLWASLLVIAGGWAAGAAAQEPPSREVRERMEEVRERMERERSIAEQRAREMEEHARAGAWPVYFEGIGAQLQALGEGFRGMEYAFDGAWGGFAAGVFGVGPDPRAAACPDEERELRTVALMGLARDEATALPLVEEILEGDAPCQIALRPVALMLLARWGSQESTGILIRLAESQAAGDSILRRGALMQLVRSEERIAVEALMRLASSDPDPEVRGLVLMYLARSEDPRAREEVRRALVAESMHVEARMIAARSLARSDRPEDREAVLAAFRTSQDRRIRETILTSLGSNGANLDLLIEVARSDPDAGLRRIAVSLLSRSEDPRARAFLREIVRGGGV